MPNDQKDPNDPNTEPEHSDEEGEGDVNSYHLPWPLGMGSPQEEIDRLRNDPNRTLIDGNTGNVTHIGDDLQRQLDRDERDRLN
jgi:hypothetical protein